MKDSGKRALTSYERHEIVIDHLKNRARNQRKLAAWSFALLSGVIGYSIYLVQSATTKLNTGNPNNESISGFLPRLTLIVVVMFMAQFFLSVFRYAVRMASHNEIRSDVLLLAGPLDEPSLKDLMDTIAPDRIDFGKEPKMPADYLIDLTKAAAAAKAKG